MFIVNRQSKRYIRGYCGSAIPCQKFLEDIMNIKKEKIEQIIKYIAPTIVSKLLSEILSREIVFDPPVNTDAEPLNAEVGQLIARGSKTTTQYDTYKTTILDQEINLFLTKDLESDSSGTDEFTIAIVAGGGTGGKSDHSGYSDFWDLDEKRQQSNGGGGGGGIFQAYNIRGKKGDLITLHIGSGGKIIEDSENGKSGKKSYIRYYKSGESSYWLYDAKSGENGNRERNGECFRGVLGGYINGDYYEGMGGNGGEESHGKSSYFYQSGNTFTFKSTGVVWPSNFPTSASGGGGGTSGNEADVFDAGAPGGWYYEKQDSSYSYDKYVLKKGVVGEGGQRGNELYDQHDVENGNATINAINYLNGNGAGLDDYGAGGGAGGVTWYESDPDFFEPTNGGGSDGGNGIGMLFRCLASDGKTSFETTFSGKTTSYAYVIVPYQYDSKQSTTQLTHSINLNLTTNKTISYIVLGGGGAGGKSTEGHSCGGGGSGGLVHGKINLVAGDIIKVSVGKGGIHNKSDDVGTNGGETTLWLNDDKKKYVQAKGGYAGTYTASGNGGSHQYAINSKFVDTTYSRGGNGGDGSDGNSGATVKNDPINVFIPAEIEAACKPYVMTKYAGGGGSGKGNHDVDYDYSGGGGGKINGSGGLGGARDGAAGEGFPAESFGGGGGGGGYSKAGHNYIGGNGASGICAIWYLM